MIWERCVARFAGRERILELGCGTGEDAILLARRGHRVLAIDASAEMIRRARLKAIAAGCAERIDFRVLNMESLDELRAEPRFDGVFSNFGAVNCVADLARLARQLAALLAPGAPLLLVVMGRHVPWEWAVVRRTRAIRQGFPPPAARGRVVARHAHSLSDAG